jgi:predicted enzyme related to lactoylglutathione lyase
MAERSEYPPGTFSWIDLGTPDVEAAKRFYTGLFGWEAHAMAAGEAATYVVCTLRGRRVAALFERQPQPDGLPPIWGNYISVQDADAAARRADELGGTLHGEPFDVLDAGRMAVISDPTGAMVSLWEPRSQHGAELVNEPGCLTWNELGTNDPETAGRFFSRLLGWSVDRVEGPEPPYWSIEVGGRPNGGMRQLSAPEVKAGSPSHWLAYFGVEELEAATARAGELGGQVLAGPIDMEAGRFAVLKDPQNTPFALWAGRFDP